MQVPASPDARVDQSTGIWIPKCLIRGRPHYFAQLPGETPRPWHVIVRGVVWVTWFTILKTGQVCVILASFIDRLGVFQED